MASYNRWMNEKLYELAGADIVFVSTVGIMLAAAIALGDVHLCLGEQVGVHVYPELSGANDALGWRWVVEHRGKGLTCKGVVAHLEVTFAAARVDPISRRKPLAKDREVLLR